MDPPWYWHHTFPKYSPILVKILFKNDTLVKPLTYPILVSWVCAWGKEGCLCSEKLYISPSSWGRADGRVYDNPCYCKDWYRDWRSLVSRAFFGMTVLPDYGTYAVKKTHCKKTTKLVTSCKFEYTLALLLTTCPNTKEWHVSPFGTLLSLLVWWSTPQVWWGCLHLKI